MHPFPFAETIGERVGKALENRDAEVSCNTLVQLFFLSSSGLIGSRYEYERTRTSGCLSELEPSMNSVQIDQKSYKMPRERG